MYALLLSLVLAQPAPASSSSPPILPTAAPAVSVSPATLNLNPAQQQTIAVTGAAPPLQTTLDRKLVDVSSAADGGSVTVTASQATGSDVLHITDANGASADVTIRVAFNAGTIVPQTVLTVTGDPAQPDWLADRVTDWVTHLTQALPGTQITIGTVSPAAPLVPGATAQFVVPVQIAGNGEYFDQTGTTAVTVQNAPLQPLLPSLLFYDDDPEHVSQDGVLFRGTVGVAQPARLYYYHDAAADDPRRLVVALQGSGAGPTSMQLSDALAGPNMDVMQVGQSVTKRFLLTAASHEGVILDLSGGRPYVMTDLPMNARQLVAGTADLRVLSGSPVTVTVLAVSPGADPLALLDGPVLPGDGHHRTGVFSIAGFGTESLRFSAGGADATTVIGDTDPTPPNVDPSADGHDYGDYGVVHTIDLTLDNPGAAPVAAYLFLQPLAGPARGSFLIDGNAVDIGCVRVPSRYQVTAFQLSPGQRYHTVVQTMTDGGSFYPVRIGVTATTPQAGAPPINAPDGCFPKPQPAASQ